MLRRALAHASVFAGAAGALVGAVPASAAVPLERQALEARVQAVRAVLQGQAEPGNAAGSAAVAAREPPSRVAQWFNWGNWNNWNNWKNWANQ
jgi:hypothetical protein